MGGFHFSLFRWEDSADLLEEGFESKTKVVISIDGVKMSEHVLADAAGGVRFKFDQEVNQELEVQLIDLNPTFVSVSAWQKFFDDFDAFDDTNIHKVLAEFLNPLFASRKIRPCF